MAWDLEKSLVQQQAIEEAERLKKLAQQRRQDAILSEVSDENSATAHRLGLSRTAFHSLASHPELYDKYLEIFMNQETDPNA